MSTITTRAGKGSPLTNNEVDANFTNLNTDKAELSGAAFTGAITTTSTVDGRDVATDGSKLDGIEAGATADQTAAEIKTAYESNADTNAFTDADESKLDGIEASADVTDTTNVTAAGALMDSELTSIASVKALNQGVATTDSPTFAGLDVNGTGSAIEVSQSAAGSATYYTMDNTVETGGKRWRFGYSGGSSDKGSFSFYNQTDNNLALLLASSGATFSGTATMDGLTVSSDSGGPVYLQDSNATATYNISELSNNAANFSLQTRDSSGAFVSTDYQIIKNASGADYHRWFTQGTERMRIDSSGNVGIGTSSPASPLHVKVTTNRNFEVENASGELRLSALNDARSANVSMQFASSSFSFISGNVGIGETDPDSTLTVKGSAHTNFQVKSNSESTKAFIQTVQDSDVRIGSSTNHPVSFYQNGAERMRIDSSGNLLVGQTSASSVGGTPPDVNGAELSKGYLNLNRDDLAHATQIQFGKNGAVVGRIHTDDRLSIGTSSTGLYFYNSGNSILPYDNSAATPVTRDNAIDLGSSGARFKNLYLSGGVYLGGTGAANLLDDYEEGTWTPNVIVDSGTNPTLTYHSRSGNYTKVGNTVHVTGAFHINAMTDGTNNIFLIDGLPFTAIQDTPVGSHTFSNFNLDAGNYKLTAYNANRVGFLGPATTGAGWGWAVINTILSANSSIRFSITYRTTA